ncbi:MAG: hypothetical protein QM496_20075 [Verrucomicrobiota bacterium]
MLKPQDILVVLKLIVQNRSAERLSFAGLAESLGISASETHAAVKRAMKCHLLQHSTHLRNHSNFPAPVASQLIRFIQGGVAYVFPAEKGGLAYGLPTSIGSHPLNEQFVIATDELLPVWPDRESGIKGLILKPLYKSCPTAARNDSKLYELLSLVDAIRDDEVRLRQVATAEFEKTIRQLERNPPLAIS